MRQRTGKRAVQINHMQPFCPRGRKARGNRAGIGAVDCLAPGVALAQAHALALAQINCRQNNHAGTVAMKFRSNCRPTAWLFSG